MNGITRIDLYEHLDVALGKESAKKITQFIIEEINDKIDHTMKTLATKEDLAKLELATKDNLQKLELTTKENLAKFELITKDNLQKLEAKLETKIGDFKIDIIRWIFAFWVTVMLMFITLLFKF